jgi:multimeric flavodoxin WrbA
VKIVAVNGSARAGGNTALLLEAVLEPLRAAGHECELIELAGKRVEGCTACMMCKREQDRQCHGRDDFGNGVIVKLDEADAIVLGSPVYFADVTSEMKALIDRLGYVSRANGNMLARKPGGCVVAVRRAGAMHALDTMNHLFLIGEMILVGSSYWNVGVGGERGQVAQDKEGMKTMRRLGENLGWVVQRLAGGADC